MKISIAKQFSEAPWGRFPSDGLYCGQNFRDNLLVPALEANEKVIIDLDGLEGLGSSFLDETFAGLVLKCGFSADTLKQKLEIVTTKRAFQMYVQLIWKYISAASTQPKREVAA